jgi:hypothetical protein
MSTLAISKNGEQKAATHLSVTADCELLLVV